LTTYSGVRCKEQEERRSL